MKTVIFKPKEGKFYIPYETGAFEEVRLANNVIDEILRQSTEQKLELTKTEVDSKPEVRYSENTQLLYAHGKTRNQQVLIIHESAEKYFKEKYSKLTAQEPGQKQPLPNRRNGITQKYYLGEITIYLRTGDYPDGSLGEIFIDLDKTGATLRAIMNCFAIMVSIALQHGVPLERIVDKFLHTRFEPAGMVQCSADIKQCASIIDLIFKDIAINYLGKGELKNG